MPIGGTEEKKLRPRMQVDFFGIMEPLACDIQSNPSRACERGAELHYQVNRVGVGLD
jgi:hypothetical protein